MQAGKIELTADAFPAFLWKGDPPGADYDPENMMDGFLEGFTLERVSTTTTYRSFVRISLYFQTMRHIFMGPSTALGTQSRGTRPCNAILHDMTAVEAAHIAYGCVQVHCHSNYA